MLRRAAITWVLVCAVLAAALFAAGQAAGPRGLRMTAEPGMPAGRLVRGVDLRDLYTGAAPIRHAERVRWDGFWRVDRAGRHRLVVQAPGVVTIAVDGETVLSGQRDGRQKGVLELAAGVHALAVEYVPVGGPEELRLRWAREDDAPRDLDADALHPGPPDTSGVSWSRALRPLRAVLGAALLLPPLALAVAIAWRRLRDGRWPWPEGWTDDRRRRVRRALQIAAPAAVVIYGGALRFEALVGRYAWEGPGLAVEAARAIEATRPDAPRWPPSEEVSGGDPFHYVGRARAMRWFYEADVREPLFPALTRLMLGPTGGRILSVHVASAVGSALVVLATYLLGAAAFSRMAGLLAALLFAVERDALWWSVEGFRDDTFALFVVLGAWALVRLWQRPTTARAVLAGVLLGAACLTRITALSFALPALLWLVPGHGAHARDRRRGVEIATLSLMVVVGPFLLACALAYGDPLYSVNYHTKFYRSRSGLEFQQAMGWLDYLRAGSPLVEQAGTGLRGLTTYPFGNKWRGFDGLGAWLGTPLSLCALAGLVLFALRPVGRLLLVVLVTSLLPYAFTWRIPGGAEWRFTMHVYPLYLLAAALAIVTGVSLGAQRVRRRASSSPARDESGTATASSSP
jgi:Dolichyl-phosphate-mannose-protein mannosyltransferase/PA14 domain